MNTKTRRWPAIAGIAMLNMLVCGIDDVTMDRAWRLVMNEKDEKAWVLFREHGKVFRLVDCQHIPYKLYLHLSVNHLLLDGNTHLARFRRGDGPSHGKLENVMPGSTFTHFTFERHDFGSKQDPITVFVGWYWTEDE